MDYKVTKQEITTTNPFFFYSYVVLLSLVGFVLAISVVSFVVVFSAIIVDSIGGGNVYMGKITTFVDFLLSYVT